MRASRYIVGLCIRIDNGKAVRLLPCIAVQDVGSLNVISFELETIALDYLRNKASWIHADSRGHKVELISVQVQEIHEEVSQVMCWIHIFTLYSRHLLNHTNNQAGH